MLSARASGNVNVERAIVVIVLACVGLVMTVAVLHSGDLGWDEAVYATKARSFVTDVPLSLFQVYRPPGLPIVGILTAPFGVSELSLRALALILGLSSLLIAWALARSLFGPVAGLVTLAAVVGSPVVLTQLRLFHNDLPTVGLLLLLMLLLWNEFERRPEPSGLLLAAGPIAAAAFYFRYGAASAIAGIAFTTVLLWAGRMRDHERLVGATAIIGLLLLVPHVLDSIARTGSPLGIVTSSVDVTNSTSPLSSLVQYVRWLPLRLAGPGVLLIIAAAVFVATLLIPSRRVALGADDARAYAWLLVPAGVASVILVLVSHAERRYVLFPVLLVMIAGSGVVVAVVGSWLRRARTIRQHLVAVGLALLVVGQIATVGYLARGQLITAEREAEGRRWAVDTGRAIAADAGGSCMVVTAFPPVIGWSSRCEAFAFAPDPSALLGRASGRPAYVVFTAMDTERANQGLLGRYRAVPGASLVARIGTGAAGVEIYRVRP